MMKKALLRLSGLTGSSTMVRVLRRGALTVVIYHGLRRRQDEGVFTPYLAAHIPVGLFETHLKFLTRHYAMVSLGEVMAWQRGEAGLPPGACLLTFDDGYESVATFGLPLLQQYHVPAAVFLTTGFLDRETPLWTDRLSYAIARATAQRRVFVGEDALGPVDLSNAATAVGTRARLGDRLKAMPQAGRDACLEAIERLLGEKLELRPSMPEFFRPLSWDDVRALHASGFVAMGAHTRRHFILSGCDDAVIAEELAMPRRRIEEELGVPCTAFAYPNGGFDDFDARVIQALEREGYKIAFTAEPGYNTPGSSSWHVKRFSVRAWMDPLALSGRLAMVPESHSAIKRTLSFGRKEPHAARPRS